MKKNHIIYTLAMVLALVSCTKEKDREAATSGQMRFAVTVEGATKASMTSADLTQFYIQITGPNNAFSYFESITKDAQGNWTASRPILWKDEESAITYAAASYGALGADYFNIPVTNDLFTSGATMGLLTDQGTQAKINAADLLTMASTDLTFAASNKGLVPITLKHGLAKVNFQLTLAAEYKDNGIGLEENPISGVILHGVSTSFNFKPLTGGVIPQGAPIGAVVPFASTYDNTAALATFEAILVPETFAAGALTLYFSVAGKDFTWTNSTPLTFEQGGEYEIPVSVAYVAPDPVITPGTMEFVEFTDGTNTVMVATMNLGATSVADGTSCYGDYYAWGATETFGTVAYTAYNAGTVTPTTGHIGGYSQANAPYYENDAYIKYTSASDATLEAADDAVAVNMPGCHMPTQAELQTLYAACGGTGESMTPPSISDGDAYEKGIYWVEGATSSITIGGDEYKANGVLFVQDATHHVFFPATGNVNGTTLYSAGSAGNYWYSSLRTEYISNAYRLNFSKSVFGNRVDTGSFGYRYYGFPVRPFKAPSGPGVTTFSELQTALSAGKDVKLMNDIVCTAEIEITTEGALTIDGNGKTLSTTSAIRAFKVESSATVAFKNLTLTGFVNGGGPAINNSGTIVLDGCTISNCHVNNSNGGGAIESTGKLYAINTTFSGNYSGEIGGAINNYWGSLYMSNCTFTDNYTTSSNAYYGGAIGINSGSEVRLINCSFSGNKYGTNTGTNDIGVYNKPTNYTIAGCTGATIASRNGDITPNTTGTATLDYSDLSNISFTYTAE